MKKINLLAFTLVLMLGAFNIELALAEEIQIDRQTFSLKPDLTYKIFKGNSHSSGQVVNQASGITFLKAQPPQYYRIQIQLSMQDTVATVRCYMIVVASNILRYFRDLL